MQMSIHLNFNGNCEEAFALYEKAFGVQRMFTMTYAEAPQAAPVPADWGDKVMHTSMQLGGGLLMGCDAPAGRATPLGGFQVSVDFKDEAEIRRVFDALAEGGTVVMPLAPTFWSPLFGMCNDRFGVGWMVASSEQVPLPAKS